MKMRAVKVMCIVMMLSAAIIRVCAVTIVNASSKNIEYVDDIPDYEYFADAIDAIINNNKVMSYTDIEDKVSEEVMDNIKLRAYSSSNGFATVENYYCTNKCIIVQASCSREKLFKLLIEDGKITDCVVYELVD